MKIELSGTRGKLVEMHVTETQLADCVITQLDEAALPDRRPALEWSGYNVMVNVVE